MRSEGWKKWRILCQHLCSPGWASKHASVRGCRVWLAQLEERALPAAFLLLVSHCDDMLWTIREEQGKTWSPGWFCGLQLPQQMYVLPVTVTASAVRLCFHWCAETMQFYWKFIIISFNPHVEESYDTSVMYFLHPLLRFWQLRIFIFSLG